MADYPLHFTNCPSCGHKGTVIAEEVQLEQAGGRLAKGAAIPIMQTKTVIFDANKKPVLAIRNIAPGIIASYDICSKCGTLYAIEIAKVQVELQAHVPTPTNNQIPPFMGAG